MKRIKTLSAITLVATLMGVGSSIMLPESTLFAEDRTIYPGKTVDAQQITPQPEDFNADNRVRGYNPKYGSSIPGFQIPDPVYQSDGSWEMLNGNGAFAGTDSQAFKRPFDTDKPFSISARAMLKSKDNYYFESDFIGLVLSTMPADKIAGSQDIQFKSKGGYALPSIELSDKTRLNVEWQTTLGTNLFINGDETQLQPGSGWWPNYKPAVNGRQHQDYVHTTNYGQHHEYALKPFYSRSDNNQPIPVDYTITYKPTPDDPSQRGEATYTTSNGVTATNPVPKDVAQLYVGVLAQSQGTSDTNDVLTIKMTGLSGTYKYTKTTINFVDRNGKQLRVPAYINSIIGERISVDGNGQQDWKAPDIEHKQLYGDGDSRTIVTQEDASKNQIYVKYDTVAGDLPYSVVDDDQGGKEIDSGVTSKKIGESYNYTPADLGDILLPDFTSPASVENGKGQVDADGKNHVNNPTVIIHVTHVTVTKIDRQLTRGVIYKMQDGVSVTPPAKQEQTFNLVKKTDLYLQSQNPNYKSSFVPDVTLNDYKSPQLEGYEPDISHVDLSQEKFDENSAPIILTPVTYHGVLKVYAPDIDFGTVHYGDRVFNGIDAQPAKSIQGHLDVANTDPNKKDIKWSLVARLDNNFMIGTPTIKLPAFSEKIDSMGDSPIIDSEHVSQEQWKDGVLRILDSSYNDKPEALKQILELKFSDLRKEHIDPKAGDKTYHGNIIWTINVAP